MPNGLNKVILIGNLGADPELRHTQSGQALARLRLATSENYTDKTGKQVEQTEWHTVIAWGKSAEIASKYLSKGRQIFVEGRLQTRKWKDKENNDRQTTEVVAQRILFLGGRGDAQRAAPEETSFSPFDSAASHDDAAPAEPFVSDFEEPGAGKKGPDDNLPF